MLLNSTQYNMEYTDLFSVGYRFKSCLVRHWYQRITWIIFLVISKMCHFCAI